MTKPIEKGWKSYHDMVIPNDAPEIQIKETRQAFYAGAALLWEYLMRSLDPGEKETDADLERMEQIQKEIEDYGQELDVRYLKKGKEH